MKQIEISYLEGYRDKIKIFYLVILCVVLVLLVRIYFYASSVISPIRYLSEVADKISMESWIRRSRSRQKGKWVFWQIPSRGCRQVSKRQSSDCKREGNPDKGEEKGGQQFLNDPVEYGSHHMNFRVWNLVMRAPREKL